MSKLLNLLPEDMIEGLTFTDMAERAAKGDETAAGILSNAGIYTGIGLANIISILNPEVVVLGGPVIEKSELYYEKAVEIAKSRIFRYEDRNIRFARSSFEQEAVSIGICALMLKQSFEVSKMV